MTIGRPTRFTVEVREKIIEAIKAGATRKVAADYVGIDASTLYEWWVQGRADQDAGLITDFSEFLENCKKAEGGSCVTWLQVIQSASQKSWQAAAWLAERRQQTEYSKQYFNPVPQDAIDKKNVLDSLMKQVIDKNVSVDDALKIAAAYQKQEEIELGREIKIGLEELKRNVMENK